MPAMRREFVLVLLAGAAGAGLVVLAVRQAWAQAIFTPPRPLPAQDISVTGQQLVPLASALALAALACLAAVIATRSVTRRAVGALLAVLGAGAAVAASAGVRTATVLAAARASALDGPLGGSTTSGASSGGAVHEIVIAGAGPGHPGRRALARGGRGRRGRDRAGGPGHRLAGPALAGHVGPVRAAPGQGRAAAPGRHRDHVGVAEPRRRPDGRWRDAQLGRAR